MGCRGPLFSPIHPNSVHSVFLISTLVRCVSFLFFSFLPLLVSSSSSSSSFFSLILSSR
ncbi:hypothetical protein BHE74_00029928 [Ensete ventricosum]|nr:hypothetical protein GW17_00046020 [Ensete ventricosum]RWW62925.1 hypothetical protein BHE74_00029928 [Ensete ventricosum]RZS06685.1 hypothetical protein BHM03_00037397 [Ensete ventricosum]